MMSQRQRSAGEVTYITATRWNVQQQAHIRIVTGTCYKCAGTEDINWPREEAPDPIARTFRSRGWQFDKHNRKKCICPDCIEAWNRHTPKEEIVDMAAPTKTGSVTTLDEVRRATRTPPPATAPPGPMTPLTAEQRAAIRRELDQYFDDASGRYLEGRSDKVIGETLSVAWKHVETMRETAYGPLRSDPGLDDVTARMAELEAAIKRCGASVATATQQLAELRRELDSAQGALATLRKRFG